MFHSMNRMPQSHGRPAAADSAPGRLAESNRVEAFSDGVFAIVITLLILDRPLIRGDIW